MVILWQVGKEPFTSLSFRRANAIARPLRKLIIPSDEVGYCQQRGESELPVDPLSPTMRLWMNDRSQMESYRRRLSDISCFMQRHSEHIARRAEP